MTARVLRLALNLGTFVPVLLTLSSHWDGTRAGTVAAMPYTLNV
ncbi:MAG TPA: hypothetical protein VMX97_05330 [Hyphomicrobiaceae bacterium]|nr:hypothetical protein [Hyphomicrobiaceae bacterium]